MVIKLISCVDFFPLSHILKINVKKSVIGRTECLVLALLRISLYLLSLGC